MIGDAIAGYIGNRIDSSDGKGGTLGALAGIVTWKVAKKVIPAALVVGGAALAAQYVSRRFFSNDSGGATSA